MSIRLDPRRLSALKLLAAEAGMRPGELVTAWVEERLDAARGGKPVPGARDGIPQAALAELTARLDELSRRVDALAAGGAPTATAPASTNQAGAAKATRGKAAAPAEPGAPKRRGRPPKPRPAAAKAAPRVPLHEEITAVISERGPLPAAEIAEAIVARGRYAPPRSGKPLDAAAVNSRVSNPAYRDRFTRNEGRIGLADGG